MKRLIITTSVCFCFLNACTPSKNAIETAIAQTQAAFPTSTFTPKPKLTPDNSRLLNLLPGLISDASETLSGKKVDVLDAKYDGDPAPITLTISLSKDADELQVGEATGITLGILKATYKTHPELFPTSLETLVLREIDKGIIERSKLTVQWDDFVDFTEDSINQNQLLLRSTFILK